MNPSSASRSTLAVFGRISLLLALGVACPAAARPQQLSPPLDPERAAVAVPAPVRPGTWQIAGVDPALPHTDLGALGTIVRKAQLVGLGESTFTSGGFHQTR